MTQATSPSSLSPAPLWIKSYPLDIKWDSVISGCNVDDILTHAAARWPDRDCLHFMGRVWTYRAVAEMADRFARALQDRGIGKGARVGLCLPNIPTYVIAYFGILRAGAIVVNFNPLYSEQEIEQQINDSGIETMVTVNLRQIYKTVGQMPGRTGLKTIIVSDLADMLPMAKSTAFRLLDGVKGLSGKSDMVRIPRDDMHVPFRAMLSSPGAPAPVATVPGDTAVLQYTGGTTGVPKAAVLTHGNLTANVRQTILWFTGGKDTPQPERMLVVLPFFHVFSMTVQMNLTLSLGGVLILLPMFRPEAVLKAIDRTRPTIFAGVPSIYKRLMEHPRIGKYDLSSLKLCVSGGAALSATIKESWRRLTGIDMVEGYGLSETSPLVLANPLHGVKKAGSVGLPLPATDLRLVDIETGTIVPQGAEGEICLRGPQVMPGYWNRPEETKKIFDADGFLHTGDVGYMDEDGYIFIVDRIKDMIAGDNGMKVFPRKVEDAIMEHPCVSEVVVAGVRDEARGEVARAWVVANKGQCVTAPDIRAFLKDRLAPYEIPKTITFRDSLPKTMLGKPDRKALRAEAEREPA